jgi:hypothetical protein
MMERRRLRARGLVFDALADRAGAGHWLPEQHADRLAGPLLAHLRRRPARPAGGKGRAS